IIIPSDVRQHSPEKIDSLAADLKVNGQLQEIIVTPQPSAYLTGDRLIPEQPSGDPDTIKSDQKFLVLAGVGRLLAAGKLGWERIRALIKEGLSDFDQLHI